MLVKRSTTTNEYTGDAMNRMRREGLVTESKDARVAGSDRLRDGAFWFPRGIVRDAVVMARQENSGIGAIGGTRRTIVQTFRILERMY